MIKYKAEITGLTYYVNILTRCNSAVVWVREVKLLPIHEHHRTHYLTTTHLWSICLEIECNCVGTTICDYQQPGD